MGMKINTELPLPAYLKAKYPLPEELIADRPLPDRSASRMMVIHRDTGMIEHRHFCDLPEYVREGDHFILNDM